MVVAIVGGILSIITNFPLGFGKVQILVTLCCGLIVMEVITESMMMSIIMPAAQCDLKLTSTDKGILSTAVFLGNYYFYI